jgi:hypothetical protein
MDDPIGWPPRSGSFRDFEGCFELYRRKRSDYNMKRLVAAIRELFIDRELASAHVAPMCFGVLAALLSGVSLRLWLVTMWVVRLLLEADRLPQWNDYEMARWQTSEDPRYLLPLFRQVHDGLAPSDARLVADGFPTPVWESGHWMLGSVMEQEPEFHRQYAAFFAASRPLCEQCRELIAAAGDANSAR